MIGKTLAHFQITAKLGEGGMGEVFRARDLRLDREVAVKVLPEAFTALPERLARFEREAKLLAALNHPQIAGIYEVGRAAPEGETREVHFLALELVEGEDLAERLARGPLPIDESLAIARQIAEALEVAHDKGIVHRDLKPQNLKWTPEGSVKILDFGLAKAMASEAGPAAGSVDLAHSPTMTYGATAAGVLLGTAAYMAPEQARGKPVDKRADIWAFGCVLFEMLTGSCPFSGETMSDTLAAVLTRELDLATLPEGVPRAVWTLLERCLVREPRNRLRDIGEARIVLSTASEGNLTESPPPVRSEESRRRPLLSVLLLLAIPFAAFLGYHARSEPEPPLRKLELQLPNLEADWTRPPQLSPDGQKVLFSEGSKLWIRDLRELEERRLVDAMEPYYFCWSPDGQQVAYVTDYKIWKIGAAGGSATPVASLPSDVGGSGGMVWSDDGRLLLAGGSDSGIVAVSEQGGNFETVVSLVEGEDRDFHEIALLPDGRGILYVVHRNDPSRERRIVDTIELFAEGRRRVVLRLEGEALQSVTYSPTGHILYHRSTTAPGVWALPFSLDRLEAQGAPFLVASDSLLPHVAGDGTLLFVHGASLPREVVELDRQGSDLRTFGFRQSDVEPQDLSADGRRLLVTAVENANWDVWVYDLELGTKARLTFDSNFEGAARWSPDGSEILVSVADTEELHVLSSDGRGESRTVASGNNAVWAAEGEGIVYEWFSPESGSWDLLRMDLSGGRPSPVVGTPANETTPVVSPDGGLLAYVGDEAGISEVYLTELPQARGKWQVSTGGGTRPAFSPRGDELFYLHQGQIVARRILQRDPLELDSPTTLFSIRQSSLRSSFAAYSSFKVGAEGRSFFIGRTASDDASPRKLVIVQSWLKEFE